jgi:hypothetical protein
MRDQTAECQAYKVREGDVHASSSDVGPVGLAAELTTSPAVMMDPQCAKTSPSFNQCSRLKAGTAEV